jgi:hypothetical protein
MRQGLCATAKPTWKVGQGDAEGGAAGRMTSKGSSGAVVPIAETKRATARAAQGKALQRV